MNGYVSESYIKERNLKLIKKNFIRLWIRRKK